jgi:hypothetical protein
LAEWQPVDLDAHHVKLTWRQMHQDLLILILNHLIYSQQVVDLDYMSGGCNKLVAHGSEACLISNSNSRQVYFYSVVNKQGV